MSDGKKSNKLDTSPEMDWFFRWIMPILLPFGILAWVLIGLHVLGPETMEKLLGL